MSKIALSHLSSAPAKLGFGDPATTVVNSDPTPVTTYFRHCFVVTNASAIAGLTLGLMRDDGAVVYVNGTEVFRGSSSNCASRESPLPTRIGRSRHHGATCCRR